MHSDWHCTQHIPTLFSCRIFSISMDLDLFVYSFCLCSQAFLYNPDSGTLTHTHKHIRKYTNDRHQCTPTHMCACINPLPHTHSHAKIHPHFSITNSPPKWPHQKFVCWLSVDLVLRQKKKINHLVKLQTDICLLQKTHLLEYDDPHLKKKKKNHVSLRK